METEDDICSVMHSYARKSLKPTFTVGSELTPLLKTPDDRPAKKPKPNIKTPEAPPVLLDVMLRVEKMQEESLARLVHIESAVKDNSASIKSLVDSLEPLAKHMDGMAVKVEKVGSRVTTLEKKNTTLHERVEELDSYKRRWNLRVAGVEERTGENVKQLIINLFSEVSPDIAGQLPLLVDIAHRLGPRSNKEQLSWRIIVQFISRSHGDKIWRDATLEKMAMGDC
ncbi:hypothetical protein QQF64_018568 [Cirrhinus molitorella]|uniref:Uncharacterized protein n=1 Tax=Cirrhinus molitorella TaxID=172907 RepID=A0ABR3LCY7_9TELE